MNTYISHPSDFIKQDDVILIRNYAADAEREGKLTAQQLEIIHRSGWFKLLVPQNYGGLQITLPDLVRLQEAISWADGSTGWVVTLCSGAGWFGGFINTGLAAQIFNTPDVCLAGSGAVSGEAEITPNGFRINGSWNYASGAHHATHFTANCIIKKDGKKLLNDDGTDLVRPFIIEKDKVELLPTWKHLGMVATGSHTFTINNADVDIHHCFRIDAAYAKVDSELYQYPFLQLAEATLAVNLSGMAMHFLDCCRDVFANKIKQARTTPGQQQYLQQLLANALEEINAIRQEFFTAVDRSWAEQSVTNLKNVSVGSRMLASVACTCVDRLYPFCGLNAAIPDTEINRVWRDLHTASQHALLTFPE